MNGTTGEGLPHSGRYLKEQFLTGRGRPPLSSPYDRYWMTNATHDVEGRLTLREHLQSLWAPLCGTPRGRLLCARQLKLRSRDGSRVPRRVRIWYFMAVLSTKAL
jgi:hypothetical protein